MKETKNLLKHLFLVFVFAVPTSVFAQVDSGFVIVQKEKIFYRVWGAGKPLVFLNGGPGFSSEGYEIYAKELSYHRKVILFDQRGTGKSKSGKKENVTITQMVFDLESLRKHLKIKKWDVFGHSFGGQYAMYYLSKHRKCINKLILSASPAFDVDFSTQTQKFKNVNYEEILTLLKIEGFEHLKKELQKEHPSKETLRKARNAVKARYYVSKKENYLTAAKWFANKSNSSYEAAKTVRRSCKEKKINKRKLEKFVNPVLIIHGASDFLNITNPFRNHEIFSNSELKIIYDSGHIMSIDQKEEYFNLIIEFLKKKTKT